MNPVIDALGGMLADLATAVSQRALATDPILHARLEALQDSCVELRCTMPEAVWHVVVNAGTLTTVHGPASAPQASLAGNAVELAAWLLPGNPPSSEHMQVQVQGDADLIAEVADILKDFKPDLGPALGEMLGPDATANLLGAAELGLQGLRTLIDGIAERNPSGSKPL